MGFLIGPNQARQRMKEDQERSVMEDIDNGRRFKEEKRMVKPVQPAEHHHVALKDNKNFKRVSNAIGSGLNHGIDFIEGRISPDTRVSGRAKKGVFNQNRMGGFRL